ncbi:hypothetical protein FB451DRAFT_1182360 [Mycena latifolia]|nr:hypothetical protein FB451DRAFT_1182360 [Mycena latifolia]
MSDSSSTFIPTSQDVLLIVSVNAMGADGLSYAFIFNRPLGGGLIIDDRGRMCDVGYDDWQDLQRLMVQVFTLEGAHLNYVPCVGPRVSSGADKSNGIFPTSWARPRLVSCAPNLFYDLGPADEPAQLDMVHFTGYTVTRKEDKDILHSKDSGQEQVAEIPNSLVELERASGAIRQKLLPYEDSVRRVRISEDTAGMVNAIESMCTATQFERWFKHFPST